MTHRTFKHYIEQDKAWYGRGEVAAIDKDLNGTDLQQTVTEAIQDLS